MSLEQEIKRVFGPWLAWARDEEVLALLEAVVSALRRRGYSLSHTVERRNVEGGDDRGS